MNTLIKKRVQYSTLFKIGVVQDALVPHVNQNQNLVENLSTKNRDKAEESQQKQGYDNLLPVDSGCLVLDALIIYVFQ